MVLPLSSGIGMVGAIISAISFNCFSPLTNPSGIVFHKVIKPEDDCLIVQVYYWVSGAITLDRIGGTLR